MRAAAILLTVLALPPVASAADRPAPVTALAYSADGSRLAAGTYGSVAVIDPKTGDVLAKLPGQTARVTALTFTASNRLAVASGEPGRSGVVRVYDLGKPDEPVAAVPAHKDIVYALAAGSDGKTLATAGYDKLVKLWDLSAPSTPRLTLTDHSDSVYGLAFHPGGKLLASAAADRAVKVWDAATGKRLYTLGDPADWVYAVAWSPDGTRLAAGGADKSIRVWRADAAGGTLARSVFAHDGAVLRLAYSPDGTTLYSVGEDGVVKAWDAERVTERRAFPKSAAAVLSLALRPDGKQLAVGRFDGSLDLFDPGTGKVAVAALPEKPKPPAVAKVTPAHAARGQTVRVAFEGLRLDAATEVVADRPGVTAKLLPAAGPGRRAAEVTVAAGAAVGPVRLTLRSAAGASNAVRFDADRYGAVAEKGFTDSARAAMAVTLPATLVGTLDRAGDTDYFRFAAAAGQHVGVQLTGADGFDPVLTVVDDTGRALAEGTNRTLGFAAPKAGTYALGVRDRDYRGGAAFAYRIHAGDVPVVTGVFPLGVQRGREADVHVDGVNLGSPHGQTVRVRVPADAKVGGRIPVPLAETSAGERPLGEAAVVAGEFPAVVAAPDGGTELRSLPATADGILGQPGDGQTVRFAAKKGRRLVVEALARRYGSPLDPAVEVLDAAGKPVPRATLRCVAKTVVTFRDHDSVQPNIRIEAWNELAANDLLYVGGELMRIRAVPGHPDADCNFAEVGGVRQTYLDTTPTHHANNTPMYKVEVHPPGADLPPNGMPVFPLVYRNDDGGPGYGKDARLFFDPPADGVYQVRVTDSRGFGGPGYAYRLTVRPPRPDFAVSVTPLSPAVWAGGAVPVTVTADRLDGFDGPIRVRLDGLPAPFAAPETFIEAGQTTTTFALSAKETMPAGAKAPPLKLVATAAIDGKTVAREAAGGVPKVVPAGDIVTTTDVSEMVIRPGKETRFVVAVERRNGFKGRVPVDVLGLPHGVEVQNIGLNKILITEAETRREVVLRAEPWVEPMRMPVAVVARREGKGTDHAAPSVLLRVEK